MSFENAVRYRRSIRDYADQPIDPDVVKKCLELATLAPNSSNMQLWEFIHVTSSEMVKELGEVCLGQQSATTAQQMVVFVTRQDKYRNHSARMFEMTAENVKLTSPTEKVAKRVKGFKLYYRRVMPLLYARFFGVLGVFRKLIAGGVGLVRPSMYQVSEADMRVVVHKTCGLAAQTFMLAMADAGYDTCPMEGLDSKRAKKLLDLPKGAEVCMIVSCGIRTEAGVWGDQLRLPFEDVYRRV